MKNSPSLAPWQRDAIAMVHEEMEYFVPQMQTKIMNEGWASIWHARIMRALDLRTTSTSSLPICTPVSSRRRRAS